MEFQLWPLVIFLLMGLLLVIIFLAGSVLYQLTHPPRLTAGIAAARGWWIDPSDASLEYDEWTLRTTDGREIPIWEIDHPTDLDGPVLIMTHDWGESRLASLQRVPSLIAHVARIIAWDLPGHGDARSAGRCHLGATEVRYLRELISRATESQPIILYGVGMGARIATLAAVDNSRISGLILERPSPNNRREIHSILVRYGLPEFPFGWLCRLFFAMFDRNGGVNQLKDVIGRLSQPVLVFSDSAGASSAAEIADAASSSEYLETDSDDFLALLASADASVEHRIRDFVSACVARTQQDRRTSSRYEEPGPVLI